MPSNLDFDSTKKFRDYILGKTLKQPNGPQTEFFAALYVYPRLPVHPGFECGGGKFDGRNVSGLSGENFQ